MKIKYIQRNKVTLSLRPTHLVWILQLEYEWVSNLKSVPSNCLKINVLCCVKNLTEKLKLQIEKDIAIFAISALKVESFIQNVRNFQFGTKTLIFRLTLKKLLTYLKSAPPNLSKCKISGKSTKP